MFVLASTHKEIINQMKSEIAFLRSLVRPEAPSASSSLVSLEANAVLDGKQEPIIEIIGEELLPPVREQQEEALNAFIHERDILLSGNF